MVKILVWHLLGLLAFWIKSDSLPKHHVMWRAELGLSNMSTITGAGRGDIIHQYLRCSHQKGHMSFLLTYHWPQSYPVYSGGRRMEIWGELFFFFLATLQFPNQGSNPGPWQWECGDLTTRLPGKSLRASLVTTTEIFSHQDLEIYLVHPQ